MWTWLPKRGKSTSRTSFQYLHFQSLRVQKHQKSCLIPQHIYKWNKQMNTSITNSSLEDRTCTGYTVYKRNRWLGPFNSAKWSNVKKYSPLSSRRQHLDISIVGDDHPYSPSKAGRSWWMQAGRDSGHKQEKGNIWESCTRILCLRNK